MPLGYERSWHETFTSDACLAYVSGSGDSTPWYREVVQPFAFQVVPPMLALSLGARTTELLGSRGGWIQAGHETELLAPVPCGVSLRYHGRIPEKYERNGRGWLVELLEVFDSGGTLLMRERRRFVVPAAATPASAGDSA